jgi:hypothetical protein
MTYVPQSLTCTIYVRMCFDASQFYFAKDRLCSG